ncbi:unnamed protein product, partial [Polarella glacialis]
MFYLNKLGSMLDDIDKPKDEDEEGAESQAPPSAGEAAGDAESFFPGRSGLGGMFSSAAAAASSAAGSAAAKGAAMGSNLGSVSSTLTSLLGDNAGDEEEEDVEPVETAGTSSASGLAGPSTQALTERV